jgi:hypothetical protein
VTCANRNTSVFGETVYTVDCLGVYRCSGVSSLTWRPSKMAGPLLFLVFQAVRLQRCQPRGRAISSRLAGAAFGGGRSHHRLARTHPSLGNVWPDIRAPPAAGLADEPRPNIGQPNIVRPSIAARLTRVAERPTSSS